MVYNRQTEYKFRERPGLAIVEKSKDKEKRMKTKRKLTVSGIIALSLMLGASWASAAGLSETNLFGSANDGYGGFTTPPPAGTEVWSLTANSVRYAFGTLGVGEGKTTTLLKSYSLDRSNGKAYKIEGVVTLTAGYGDDNNRIGMLLFKSTDTQTADGGDGLWLRLNADDNQTVTIEPGINGAAITSMQSGVIPGDLWIGQTLTYTADCVFTNAGGTDSIDVTFKLAGATTNYTLNAVVPAASYTGTYFGFGTKWRQRGTASSGRDAPPIFDYKTFSVVQQGLVPDRFLKLIQYQGE